MSARDCPFLALGTGCAALLLVGQLGCSPRYELLRSLDEDGAAGSLNVSGGTGAGGGDVGGSVGVGGYDVGVGGYDVGGVGGYDVGGNGGSGGISGSAGSGGSGGG